jgi:hypothetical protein
MPLFRRADGALVKDDPPVRRIMPYLMRARNESVVYHETRYDLTRTLPWLAQQNAAGHKVTLFQLVLYAIARTLHERPGLNRFVSGGRVYQRKGVQLSFAAKRAFADDAPIATVKVAFGPDDPFADCVTRVNGAVGGARRGEGGRVDTELKLALLLPGFLLRMVMGLLRWLDRVNLLPGSMTAPDPMFASCFVANLGSLGLSDTFHHLYEYGTVSLFAAVGRAEKMLVVGPDGAPAVRDGLQVCWSFDERIHDGFYCARSLGLAQQIVEDPAAHVHGAQVAPLERRQA